MPRSISTDLAADARGGADHARADHFRGSVRLKTSHRCNALRRRQFILQKLILQTSAGRLRTRYRAALLARIPKREITAEEAGGAVARALNGAGHRRHRCDGPTANQRNVVLALDLPREQNQLRET